MAAPPHPLAIVTGANRGLGLEVARQLTLRGSSVVLTARKLEAAQRAAAEISGGDQVIPKRLDVTDPASVEAFSAWSKRELGPLQALINNAGVSLQGFDESVVERTLAANFYGALRVSQALAPLLGDGANLVMVSSGMGELSAFGPELKRRFLDPELNVAGLCSLVEEFAQAVGAGRQEELGWPSSAYRVSKAALNALTRILARSEPRLHVNAVCPGWVRTDMGGSAASRSVEQGASGIVWAATLGAGGPSGGFFRDGKPIAW